MSNGNSNYPGGHVAVLAFPFSSHAAMVLAVVRRLAAGSPETRFSFFNTRESNKTIFNSGGADHLPTNIQPHDVWDGVPEGHVFTGKPQERIELFMEAAPETLRRSTAGRDVTCLVTDAFFWFAADVAQDMGVPWVAFWAGGPNSLSTHIYTDLIRTNFQKFTKCDETTFGLSFLAGMSKVKAEDLPEGVVFGNLESSFSKMLHRMGRTLPRAAALFLNSFDEVDATVAGDLRTKLKNFLGVGPANLAAPAPPPPDDNGCLRWLDEQEPRSVAYISFGTAGVLPPEEVAAIAQALEGSGVPFVWSLKADMPKGVLERIERNGKVVAWAPQTEILRHRAVGVFVTHCGWNSLMESIAGGVPMIGRPFFGDQRLNGGMIEDVWEIGIRVETGVFTKGELERCLGLVLSGERGNRMRDKIKVLNGFAKEAVGINGTSTRNFNLLQNIVTHPK